MQLFLELAPFVLVTAAILACAYVFLSLKGEIHVQSRRLKQQQERFDGFQSELTAELDSIKIRLQDAEDRAGVLVAPTPARSGLNLSKRSQALRMSRIGERPENIAAALSLPRKEIELLLRVQKIVLSSNSATS